MNINRKVFIVIIILWGCYLQVLSAKVWINEFMQSNVDLVRDDLQEFPDSWIELYNDSDQSVNIQNWTISDDSDYRKGWRITSSTIIAAKSYRIIYADRVGRGLHANFRLDSGNGGAIYLFDNGNRLVDAVINIPRQPAPNISRGRITDGHNSWSYFVTATPGASNNTEQASSILLPSPVFSQKGGLFRNTVRVSLSLPLTAPSAISLSNIHYTLDNTEPTKDSPTYTGELTISTTTVVRAKLIHPNYLTDRAVVHTYIITSKNYTLPIVSISVDPSYLYDPDFGIYVRGSGKFGVAGKCLDYPVNWNHDWRRPINFEYFPVGSSTSALNQLCEMRIHGGCTRANPQKSLCIYANKRFGINRFYYDLFREKPNQEIKSFVLRNSGNDFWWTHFRDAAIQLFFGGKVDVDYQAYQPTIFFLNGNYWGIQNMRERSNSHNVLANHGTEDVDVISNWWGEVNEGDRVAFNQLMTELRKSASQRNYEWIMNQVDIDEFINYMILQMYVSNTDWPHNNMVMWRPRTADGKWRFILKDLDFGLGIWDMNTPSHNSMRFGTENNNDERKLFNALLTQESFRKKFYGRYAVYMGDLLHYKSTSNIIDSIQRILEPVMEDHIIRWRPEMWWRDMPSWRNEVSRMKVWCNSRNANVYRHLQDHFRLGAIMKLTFEKPSNSPAVFINDIRMRSSGLDGSYFQKETLELRYIGNAPYGWEITQTVSGNTTVETIYKQNLSFQIPEGCTAVSIKLVAGNGSGNGGGTTNFEDSIIKPESKIFVWNDQLQVFDLQSPSVISIYDVSGRLIFKTSTSDDSIVIPLRQHKGVFIVHIQNNTQSFTQKVVVY